MKTTPTGPMIPVLLGLLLSAASASALDYCTAAKACKAGTTCMAGACIPDTLLCKSDAACDPYETCDFTCPFGVAVAVSGGSTEPEPSAGSGSAGSSPGKKVPGSGEGEKNDVPGASSGGSGSSGGSSGSGRSPVYDCPEEVGICRLQLDKIPIDEGCKKLCEVASKCDNLGDSGTSNPPGETTPADPPDSGGGSEGGGAGSGSSGSGGEGATPVPAPGGGDSGSSDEKGAGDDQGGPEDPPAPGAGREVPARTKSVREMCEQQCSAFKRLKVATAELAVVQKCVAEVGATPGTCQEIEGKCKEGIEKLQEALDGAADLLMLKLGGLGSHSEEVTLGAGPKGGSSKGAEPNAEQDRAGSGGAGSASAAAGGADSAAKASGAGGSGGGCTASGPSAPAGSALLLLLAMTALALRRRRAA